MKNKSAFTLIELIFVIIVLGILASLAMGRMERDLKQEASETILSHIRLTQQLALSDNKHLHNNNGWQQAYWRIQFLNCSFTGDVMPIYNVGSDADLNNALSTLESAINPTNGKYLYAICTGTPGADVSEDIYIGQHFGVKRVDLRGCTSGSTARQIAFDYLGRPHRGVGGSNDATFNRIVRRDCNLTVTMSDSSTFSIIIENETGHSYIEGQDNS